MAKKKTKEDQLMERLFGHLKPERVQVDLANVVERLAEELRRPVPKKRLVPKKILAIEQD